MYDEADDGAEEQEETYSRLNKKSRQALFGGLAVAEVIDNASGDPDEAEQRGHGVVEIKRAKPQRHQECRQPFQRILMNAKDALEIEIARYRRML